MLLTLAQLAHAVSLTHEGVIKALEVAGYSDNRIIGARFVGMNEATQFIYDILFENDDNEFGLDNGRVFLEYKEVNDDVPQLHGEF